MKRLTRLQHRVLDVLAIHDEPMTPVDLGRLTYRPKEGAASTASSLVRRGLVYRVRDERGRVSYLITDAGRAASPALQMAAAVRDGFKKRSET